MTTDPLRVLYYNWVDCLDPQRRGGGVTVYQANLRNHLADDPRIEAHFLSSGVSHDLVNTLPRLNTLGPARYEIVNSGVLAPSPLSYRSPHQISHAPTTACFAEVLRRHGPFDVVHFNGLEGVPIDVLELRAAFPDTRFILSLHNYYPFCPQVNLWYEHGQSHCDDFDQGRKCVQCPQEALSEAAARKAYATATGLRRFGIMPDSWAYDILFRKTTRALRRSLRALRRAKASSTPKAPAARPGLAPQFLARRQQAVESINRHCDRVLCVSQRVEAIAVHHGIDPDLTQAQYIGTDHAMRFEQTQPRPLPVKGAPLTLGYLGYMRDDKGFAFLMRALAEQPPEVLTRLRLVIAAPKAPGPYYAAMMALKPQVAALEWIDGYAQSDLDAILAQVDLGVVPVLWEDNLPQVAIEMHARRIPMLTSDRGGAQELGGTDVLTFRSGDVGDFGAKLAHVLDGDFDSLSYWQAAQHPVSMPAHIEALHSLYLGGSVRRISPL